MRILNITPGSDATTYRRYVYGHLRRDRVLVLMFELISTLYSCEEHYDVEYRYNLYKYSVLKYDGIAQESYNIHNLPRVNEGN